MTRRTAARRRLALVVAGLAMIATAFTVLPSLATTEPFPSALPKATCGPGALPESSYPGRVPSTDYASGRYRRGYQCNATLLGRQGATGGFKVERYVDATGRTCAYYDSTLLSPKDTLMQAVTGLGVVVLDMSNPAKPVRAGQLVTPAMQSPHESVLVNQRRGLLAAVLGNPATNVGIVDLYDIKSDCRSPRLLSSTPTGLLGHESGFAADGRTFYASSAGGSTLTAIDVTTPTLPRIVFSDSGPSYHGVRLSTDGRTMYAANLGSESASGTTTVKGLRILDVSQIQTRQPDPQVRILSDLTWRTVSIPQSAEPFVRNGHRYVFEVDEYTSETTRSGSATTGNVGAARIINVDDPRRPYVVSDLRLAVHQPRNRAGTQRSDPGASLPVQGYAGHYCRVQRYTDPNLVACSMIASGLRVFDIRQLREPREAAYFNRPVAVGDNPLVPNLGGAFAMSRPVFDPPSNSIWYSDGNSGFYAVRMTNGVQNLF